MESDKCLICSLGLDETPKFHIHHDKSINLYSCKRCGDYWVDSHLKDTLPYLLDQDIRKIAVLSHWIRMKHEVIKKTPPDSQGFRKFILLDQELVSNIINRSPPTPAEQADNFVIWIGDNTNHGRHYIPVNKFSVPAIIGSITPEEFSFVFEHLKNQKIIEHKNATGRGNTDFADVTLSFSGWEYYFELKRGKKDSRRAFMAMEYGDTELDKIFADVFKPAVKETGYDLFRLIDRPKAGLIDDRLRVEIKTSRFLIADLTHENAGAYWEAGYAEGLGKPVIYTCKEEKFEEEKTHFDTNHHLTVLWNMKSTGDAAKELKATIRATLPDEAKLSDDK